MTLSPLNSGALLEWYVAMGVDEALEETPQNHIKNSQKTTPLLKPTSTSSTTLTAISPATSSVAPIPRGAPQEVELEEVQKLAAAATDLTALEKAVRDFQGLSICKTATNTVFADGVAGSDLLVIGEAPGAQEDRQGIPFCGPSGKLLDQMLAATGFNRETNCYITNTIFWRPPGNRTPTPEEIVTCRPFVEKHIALLKPKIILLTGGVAIRSVLQQETSISRLRGNIHTYRNKEINVDIPVVATYHPSYLLRQPLQKRLAWADMLTLKALLSE